VPNAPNVDGLPVWLQVLVYVGFVAFTGLVAFTGYRKRVDREPPGAASTMIGMIPDMAAIRHLSDCVIRLTAAVEHLQGTLEDHTHHMRNNVEVTRDLGQHVKDNTTELRQIR
jgi:hypothetical protein